MALVFTGSRFRLFYLTHSVSGSLVSLELLNGGMPRKVRDEQDKVPVWCIASKSKDSVKNIVIDSKGE